MNLPKNCTVYLVVPPDLAAEVSAYGLPLAHMAYRVGDGPHLFRTQLRFPVRNGVMVVDCQGFDGRGTPEVFCREVVQECSARGFSGMFCDFEGYLPPVLQKALEHLAPLFQKRNWKLYLPESCAAHAPSTAKIVISTAISGGSLQQRLAEAIQTYGDDRIVLGLERVTENFTLPATTGSGTPMSQEELSALIRERAPSVYFSSELCAHYFTYMSPGESAHFILYDDAASMAKKLHVAAAQGIQEAFLPYPQNKTLLSELLDNTKTQPN